MVLAHLAAQSTRKNDQSRLDRKLFLSKRLYDKGYSQQEILDIIRFVEWVMVLPDELEREFRQQLIDFEEEKNMPYISTIERWSLEKGRVEGHREMILGLLVAKVGVLSVQSQEKVAELEFDRLQALGLALLNFATEKDLEGWLAAEEGAA